MTKRVRHEVEEDALELVRRQPRLDALVHVGAERDAAGVGLRLELSQRGRDERRDGHLLQLEREHPGVDPGQLEEVVDQRRERAHLLAQRREVVVGGGEAVLDRLEHRLHRRDRGAEVVARPGDELPARVEELLERGGHGVEGRGELRDLPGALDRGPRRQIAGGERPGGCADPAAARP